MVILLWSSDFHNGNRSDNQSFVFSVTEADKKLPTDFSERFSSCNTWLLSSREWSSDAYVCSSFQLQSTASAVTNAESYASHLVQEVTRACRTLKCKRITWCKKWHPLAAHWNVNESLGERSDTDLPHTEMYASHWVQDTRVTRACRILNFTRVTVCKKWHAPAAHWNVNMSLGARMTRACRQSGKNVGNDWTSRGVRTLVILAQVITGCAHAVCELMDY